MPRELFGTGGARSPAVEMFRNSHRPFVALGLVTARAVGDQNEVPAFESMPDSKRDGFTWWRQE